MKYFRLIWKNAWRKRIRTSLTILSVFVAFLLFALLSAIGYAFKGGVDVADADRLIIIHKVSLINLLPISYQNRVASIDGVDSVTHSTWFGGYYQEPRNQFPQFPVDPQAYFDMYPEFKMPPEQLEAFKRSWPIPMAGSWVTGYRSRQRSGAGLTVLAPGNSNWKAFSRPTTHAAARR
jgi:putative ABC transport system permease protein